MSEKDRLAAAIHSFFVERGKRAPEEDCDFFESGLIDSMELLELLMFLEDSLSLEIDQDLMTADNFRSIKSIVATLGTKNG